MMPSPHRPLVYCFRFLYTLPVLKEIKIITKVCVCVYTTHWAITHAPATITVAYSAELAPQLDKPNSSKFDTLIDIIVTTDQTVRP